MATNEVVRDQPRVPLAPIDESVVVPQAVRDAAARADAFYQQQQPETPPPQPDPAAETPPPQPDPAVAAPPAPEQPPMQPPDDPEMGNFDPNVGAEGYFKRFRSMQGRYNKSQQQIDALQEQMSQLGDELIRTQQMINTPAPQQAPRSAAKPLITPEDEANFGTEIIDLTKRAAREAVAGDLDALRNDNAELRQKLQRGTAVTLSQVLDRDVPRWRDINRSPAFKNWLRLRDIYSGGVRQQLLNTAYQAADAPRVVAFFKGFMSDEAATGHVEDPQAEPPASPPAPRQPAVALSALTAPGRARPASGETPSADKPVFTRANIAKFYNDVRAGVYAGREVEKDSQERAIFAAQREGRVR